MIQARPSAELLKLLHELSAIAGLPGPDAKPTDCDWGVWLDLAEEHQVSSFLGSRAVSGSNPFDRATERPLELQNFLRGAYIQVARDSAFMHSELQRILAALRPVADPIALKGAALAYTLYDHPSERFMTDIDLLLSSEEASAAAAILQEHGYESMCPTWDHHHLPPLRHPVREVTVELHTNLATPGLPEPVLERMRSETRSVQLADGSRMRILDPPARLIHHAIHALRNPVGDPLVRNLFEVAWIAASLDVAELKEAFELSRQAGVDSQVATACALAEQLFGSVHGIPAPAPGAVRFWCGRRLNWVKSPSEAPDRWSRWKATMARQHLFAARAGASDRSPIPMITALFDSVASEQRRLRGALRGAVRCARAQAAEVGDGLLVENLETGEVHILSGSAVQAWRCAQDGIGRRELGQVLRRSGLEDDESRRAVGALQTCGLLVPQAG
jgi:hypothetical protein